MKIIYDFLLLKESDNAIFIIWSTVKLVGKNRKIGLTNAKKTIEKLEGK